MTRTSFPDYRLVLSPKAEQDIENILRNTGEQWGEKQIPVYRDKLAEALESLLSDPTRGHVSSDLPETYRVCAVAAHVIVYRL